MERIVKLLTPHAPRLVLVVCLLLVLAGLNMVMPVFIKLLLDHVFPYHNWSLLWIILSGIVGIYIVRNLVYFMCKYRIAKIGEDLSFTIRNQLFEQVQRRSLQFHRENRPGEITSRMMNDTFSIQSFIQDEAPTLLQALVMFVGLLAIIYAVNWQLALASTVVLPIHLATAHYLRAPIKEYSRRSQEQLAVVQGSLIEKLLGVEVVKGFAGEARESRRFRRATALSREHQMTSRKYHTAQKVVADLLIGIGTIALLGFGAYQVMGPRQMSPGTFVAFFSYVLMLYPVVIQLMSGFAKLTRVTASADRISELMEKEPETPKTTRHRGLPPAETRGITFDKVSFQFQEEGPRILKDINLEIPKGKTCAIVGPAGAGKSTLVSLIPCFLQPTGGRLLIDGVDTREVPLLVLRNEIGISFQENFLFQSSILENLRYARPGATLEEIRRIAALTGVDHLIDRLPNGYGTRVGEKGVALSRGEKQAITLTRALLKDPRILILDEATASLDEVHEAAVLSGVLNYMKPRTILIITHKMNLIRYADLVAHLEGGRLTYQGTPERFAPYSSSGEKLRQPASKAGRSSLVTLLVSLAVAGQAWLPMPAAALGADAVAARVMQDTGAKQAHRKETGVGIERPEQERAGWQDKQEIGRLLTIRRLNRVEIEELLDVVMSQLEVERGYRVVAPEHEVAMAPPPRNVESVGSLMREVDDGERVLRFGYLEYVSQPLRVWIHGEATGAAKAQLADDLALIEVLLSDGREVLDAQYDDVGMTDLITRRITLSYIDVDRCLALLKSFGFQTIEFNSASDGIGRMRIIEPTAAADLQKLPIILSIPETEHMDLVSGAEMGSGTFGLGMATGVATRLEGHTSASPGMEILVLYHPARPEQFSAVENLIRTTLDVPARQILIEALVLEISRRGLTELGVEWTLEQESSAFESIRLGRLMFDQPTLDVVTRNDLFGLFQARLQALVTSGEAEVLSRPSVLTLDNRQASIRVGEEIPVATSLAGLQVGDKVSFEFRYIPVGILLNVRPRISATGNEVTMQIDGSVSAQMAGQDLVIFDQQRQELARAPRVSTRRVQTYSRVADSTPFIIGGLISRNEVLEKTKVPFLGDIPLLGMLFRHSRSEQVNREVIIVLTPFVLEEGHFVVDRRAPGDDDAFDRFGQELHRDSYRVRTQDVFDLDFLTRSRDLRQLQRLADRVAAHNIHLGESYPFVRFTQGRIPGENILVYRQIYNVINRLQLDQDVDLSQVIFFQPNPAVEGAFSVAYLLDHLEAVTGTRRGRDPARMLQSLRGYALAITFTQRDTEEDGVEFVQATPDVRLVRCPDRETWDRLLWELNQPDEQGLGRRTILLHAEDDLRRLRSAIQVKAVVRLNSDHRFVRLNQFTVGRQLVMPSVAPEQIHLLDLDTARYFFYSQHYYPAQRQQFQRHMEALVEALHSPVVRRYVRTEWIPEVERRN
jgi:ABC-type multidrug transport system fused ATPase/permease subunit